MGAAELGVLGFLLVVLFGVKKVGNDKDSSDSKNSSKEDDKQMDTTTTNLQANRKIDKTPNNNNKDTSKNA